MSRWAFFWSLVGSLVICVLATSAIRADTTGGEGTTDPGLIMCVIYNDTPPPNPPAKKKVTVNLTDKNKKPIVSDVAHWPRDVDLNLTITPSGFAIYRSDAISVPPSVQPNGVNQAPVPAVDYKYGIVGLLESAPFKEIAMDVESIQHNAVDGWFIANVFDQVAAVVGVGVDVDVPFIDSLDDANFYALVDISAFLNASPPTVNLFDTLTITDGQSVALPGMLFSSTPFELDAVDGLQYTPFNGDAQVIGDHTLMAVPEPSSVVLAALGLLGLAAYKMVFQSLG